MDFPTLTVSVEDGVAVVTINRPDKLNALNAQVIGDLDACFEALADDTETRAVVLTGAGDKAFVAGADITQFADLDAAGARALAQRGQQVFRRIEQSTKPVVAAVGGFALGGGCELALACHIRIASDKARFGQPEVNLGLIPGYGGTQRLPRVVGHGVAMEMILTGDAVTAERALAIGLVSRVVPSEELMPAARGLARKVASRAPVAIRLAAEAIESAVLPIEDGLRAEADLFGRAFQTEDVREGVSAFLERRKPDFKGR